MAKPEMKDKEQQTDKPYPKEVQSRLTSDLSIQTDPMEIPIINQHPQQMAL